MSNRITARSIRLMGHYNRTPVAASATAIVTAAEQASRKSGCGKGNNSHDNDHIRTTMATPALNAPFLPPGLKEDNAYTIAIDRHIAPCITSVRA